MHVLALLINIALLIGLLYLLIAYFRDERKNKSLAPWVESYHSHKTLLMKKFPMQSWGSILDMWCGNGKMLRFFLGQKWYARGVGYDIRRTPIFVGNYLNSLYGYSRKIDLHHKDFTHADVANYDMIYLFLRPEQMVELEPRLRNAIGPHTRVITNTFHFPTREATETIKDKNGKEIFRIYSK